MIAVIWLAMLVFFNDMNQGSKLIFYLVTSWMLFLIVGIVKEAIRQRKGKN
ncbi:hypothetical protein [Oceanobacillus senegalensis]|uniref:hypothetical protein n=1 Tax=Oceanobacillus senegalensis TaxID=1936063 RepID=UPI001FE8D501|nr:hypothetical protein [Oceanobacillus senegalensis]